ncbi:MAG: tetratricopeptide repeat protein [Alistipes sp.]|nr:tetratricopeptide repeat protein [Alistipes sp.]
MSKEIKNSQEAAVAEAVSKTEVFFENNSKKFLVGLLLVVVLIAGGYAYKALVLDKNAERAANLIVDAQQRFGEENADFALALNGDENGAGFLDVIEQYGSTPVGNLAKHYAGICYVRLGDWANAEKYLAQFDEVDGISGELINAQNAGLRGDVAVEQDKLEEAVAHYKKAIAASKNNFSAPTYLHKLILVYAALGNAEEAEACFEQLRKEYPFTLETREAEKVIGVFKK